MGADNIDDVLARLYTDWANLTDATPILHVAGTNPAPSGSYADEDPPTTGLGYAYELIEDPEATGYNVWTITYTPEPTFSLLLETDDNLLMEDGASHLLLESD